MFRRARQRLGGAITRLGQRIAGSRSASRSSGS